MLVKKAHLSVRHAAHKDSTHYLHGIRLEDGLTVGTDGHMLAVARVKGDEIEGSPLLEHVHLEGVNDTLDCEPVTLTLESVEEVAKMLPKKKALLGNMPVLANALLEEKDGQITATTTDLETVKSVQVKKGDGGFPRWPQVLPEGQSAVSVVLDLELLTRFAKVVKDFLPAGTPQRVRLELFDDLSPIRLTAEHDDVGKLTGIVMSIRVSDGALTPDNFSTSGTEKKHDPLA